MFDTLLTTGRIAIAGDTGGEREKMIITDGERKILVEKTKCATCPASDYEWEMTHIPDLGKYAYVCENCWINN